MNSSIARVRFHVYMEFYYIINSFIKNHIVIWWIELNWQELCKGHMKLKVEFLYLI